MNKILLASLLVLIMSNMTIAQAQPQTDPAADLLNRTGSPTAGEPYLDIVESNVEVSGDNYVATIKLAGEVPSAISSSDVFIEWDIMIDVDESNTTGAWGVGEANIAWRKLMVNGIGVDLMIRLAMSSSGLWGEAYWVADQTWGFATPKVSGNEITLTEESAVLQSRMGHPGSFDFTVLVKKYGVGGGPNALPAANTLQAFDKAPNSGYYAFRTGAVTAVPEFPAVQLLAAVILSVTLLAHNLNKRREEER